jgi:hypothetical protein
VLSELCEPPARLAAQLAVQLAVQLAEQLAMQPEKQADPLCSEVLIFIGLLYPRFDQRFLRK